MAMAVSPLVDIMNSATANALQSTMTVNCPRSMVGRVIGKGGETIKALQQYTGAMIQIDQSQDPTRVTIAGDAHSLRVATSMVKDIVEGNFKGFAMLRQMTLNQQDRLLPGWDSGAKPQPVYIEGYGFVPPSQFMGLEDTNAALAQTLRETAIAQQSLPLSATDAMGSMTQSMAASGQYGSLPTTNGGNRSPAARRLFQGGAGPSGGVSTSAPSSSFPAGGYQSAPTSPQNGMPNGTSAGVSASFDPRSAPNSPQQAALASFSLSPHTAPMSAAFSNGGMDMGVSGMPTAQQALQLMGRHDFLSASAGIAGLTPESAAALQVLGAAAAASRLGLDSSVASHAAFSGAQHMDAGPRSASLGALGTRTAAGFMGAHKADNFSLAEVLAKGSPASSFNSSTSLFSGGGAVPVLPDNWVQLTDPEGRHFFMNVASRASQWEFPSPA